MAAYWTQTQVLTQLISGYRWTGSTITYAFPATSSGIFSNGEAAAFRPVTSAQQASMVQAIMSWDDLIPQSFQNVQSGTSNIEFAFTTTSIDYAHAYYPAGGSIWFLTGSDVASATIGSYGYSTIMHELGHALGLRHMGDYDGAGGVWAPSSYQDSRVLSLMSYFGPGGGTPSSDIVWADWIAANGREYSPQTPMLYDVMAIQAIYGSSTTTRTENTIYGFSSNIAGAGANIYNFTLNQNPVLTIFDSDGIDTINASGWSSNSSISLVAGSYSSCNYMTNNIAIAFGCVIENAVGGSGNDILTGNSSANRLEGGIGNDVLTGGSGNDILNGGSGNDTFNGGDGDDTAIFSGLFASYTLVYQPATGALTISGSSSGTDLVSGVELFQFADGGRTFNQLAAADTAAPTLVSSSPADNAAAVQTGANIEFTFSEFVRAGTGNIVIYQANNTVAASISITDTSQVRIVGNIVTVNLRTDLTAASSYYVTIAAGVITDMAGNKFAGISGPTAYGFSTSAFNDTVAPALLSMSPADNATSVATGANLILTFNESVLAGSGDIVLYNANGTIAKSMAVSDTSQIVFAGTTVTINPFTDLVAGNSYYLAIAAGAIRDIAGNAYGGLSGATAYNFTVSAPRVTDDYPWSTSTTGVVLVNGAASSGQIESVDDGDVFKVSLNAGVKYVFSLNAASGSLDPYLYLYSPSGERITSDDDSGGSVNSEISYVATLTGTFYLGATDFSTNTGGYTLTAKLADTSNDDFTDTKATTGLLSVGGQVGGTIETAFDEDWVKVYLQANIRYVLELVGADSGAGTLGAGVLNEAYLRLYDSNGYYLKATADGGAGGDPLMAYTPTTSGYYYLSASELFGMGTGTYRLKASVSTIADDYSENTTTSGVLAVGSELAGTIEIAADHDWVKIYLQANTPYVLELLGADSGGGTLGSGFLHEAYLGLYDSNGYFVTAKVDGGTGGDPLIAFTPTTSGYYYLAASELFDGGVGTYKFRASALTDDYPWSTVTTGRVVINGAPSTGIIGTVNDADLFAVVLTAGVSYTFDLARTSGGLDDPYLLLFDPSLTRAASDDDSGGSPNARISYTAPASGTYYLGAADAGSGIGAYSLSARAAGTASYAFLASGSSVNEGASVTYTLTTTNVAAGTALNYTLTGISAADIAGGSSSGAMTVASSGVTAFTVTLVADRLTEGNETMLAQIADAAGTVLARANGVLVNDTSLTTPGLSLVGTSGNDTLSGGSGNDSIDGGAGIDTVRYAAPRSDFKISATGGGFSVTDNTGAGGTDFLIDVERITFSDAAIALDISGNAGQAYRIYQAAFNRTPDPGGVGFWLKALDSGLTLADVAASFVSSAEFKGIYGSDPSNADLLTRFYQNVLHRPPEPAGFNFWLGVLDSKAVTPAQVLTEFSESGENQAALIGVIGNGFGYTPF
ncbi:MAG: Ig-like domain-containing protein [Telluria sp.]|nr:Ig-like domain-containing protein [Telluria sp.]